MVRTSNMFQERLRVGQGRRLYRFVATAAQYEAAGAALARGVVPLLDPGDDARRARWERVLAWYGAEGEGSDGAIHGATPSDRDVVSADDAEAFGGDGGVVVALGSDVAPVASVLARARRRSCVVVDDLEALSAIVAQESPRSLVLVGLPKRFVASDLRRLQRMLTMPWSIITGIDVPAVAFLAAKQLLTPPRRLDEECIDVVNHSIEEPSNVGRTWPAASEWESLDLVTHSEGAHIHVGSLVLCGLPDDHERTLDDRRLIHGGCAVGASGRVCRRSEDETEPFPVRELRVRDLQFLTCSGFVAAGEAFPSNVSVVLAAAEGYARSVLTTDQRINIDRTLPRLVTALRRSGADPSALKRHLDDAYDFQTARRPFVLVGDVASDRDTLPVAECDGSGTLVPPRATLAFAAPAESKVTVWRIRCEDGGKPPVVVRTRAGGFVVDTTPGRRMHLGDASRDWSRLAADIQLLERRLVRAAQWERAVAVASRPDGRDGVIDCLATLGERRAHAESMLFLLRNAFVHVRRTGVWNDRMPALQTLVDSALALWDESCATLLLDHVLGGDYEPLFSGYGDPAPRAAGACDRCAAPLDDEVAFGSLLDRGAHHRVSCPICGFREAWTDGGIRLSAKQPASILPGQHLELDVDHVSPDDDSAAAGGELVVLATARRGQYFVRTRLPLSPSGRTRVPLPAPPELKPDLRTVKLAAVRRMSIAILRLRLPVLRA